MVNSGSLGRLGNARSLGSGSTTILNDLCDPGRHLPLSEPCFIHLYLPCWGVSDHVSSDGCSEQVCVLPQFL